LLLEVGAHDIDELGGAFVALVLRERVIYDVQSDVILDHLRHQAVDCPADAGDQLQHVGAALFLLQGSFDSLHLAANAAHTIEQFQLLASCV